MEETPILRADATDDDLQLDDEFKAKTTEFLEKNDELLRRLDDKLDHLEQGDRGVEHVKAILNAGIAPTPGFASKPDDPHGDEIPAILSHGYGSVSIGPDEYCGVSSCLTVKPPHRHPELEPAPGFATGGVVGKSGGPYGDEVPLIMSGCLYGSVWRPPVEDEPDNV